MRPEIIEASRQFRSAWLIGAVIVGLQIADILSTEKILLAGGLETNPLVSKLILVFGSAWWIPKLVLASFIAGYFGTRKSRPATIIAILFCVLVAAHNLFQPL